MRQEQRVKYPLTNAAKLEAKHLVEAWDRGEIQQFICFVDHTTGNAKSIQIRATLGAERTFETPPLGVLKELGEYKLINLNHFTADRSERYEVTLLQELRNAVASDFDVSDFFLTTSAIGTIIHGDLILREDSSFQSAASGIGDVSLIASNLPAKLRETLGPLLVSQPPLAAAIDDFERSDAPSRQQRLGMVIAELGRSLQHVANATTIIVALDYISKTMLGGRF